MPFVHFQRTQRLWYSLPSLSPAKSEGQELVMDTLSVRALNSEAVGSKGRTKAIVGKVTNSMQSPSAEHANFPENELDHHRLAAMKDRIQWPSKN